MAGFNLFKRKGDKKDRAAEAASAEANSLARLEFLRMDSTNLLAEPIPTSSSSRKKDTAGPGVVAEDPPSLSLMDDILGTLMSSAASTPPPPQPEVPVRDERSTPGDGNTYKVYRLGSSTALEGTGVEGGPSTSPSQPTDNDLSAHDILRFIRGDAEKEAAAAARREQRRAVAAASSVPGQDTQLPSTSASRSSPQLNLPHDRASSSSRRHRDPSVGRNPRLPATPPLTPSSSRDELKLLSGSGPISSSASPLSTDLERRSQSRSHNHQTTQPHNSSSLSTERKESLSRSHSLSRQRQHAPSPNSSGGEESRGRWRQGMRRRSSSGVEVPTTSSIRVEEKERARSKSRSRSRSRIAYFFDKAKRRASDDGSGSDDDKPLAMVQGSSAIRNHLKDHMTSAPLDTVTPSNLKRHNAGGHHSSSSGSSPVVSRQSTATGSASVSRRPSQTNREMNMSRQSTGTGLQEQPSSSGRRSRHNSGSKPGSHHPALSHGSPQTPATSETRLRSSNSNPNLSATADTGKGEAGNVESWVRSVNAVNSHGGSGHRSLAASPSGGSPQMSSGRSISQGASLSQGKSSENVHVSRRTGRAAALAAAAVAANVNGASGKTVRHSSTDDSIVSSIPSLSTGSSLSNLISSDVSGSGGSAPSPSILPRRQASGHVSSSSPNGSSSLAQSVSPVASNQQQTGLRPRRSKGNLKSPQQTSPLESPNAVGAAAAAIGLMLSQQQNHLQQPLDPQQQQQQQLAALSYIAQVAAAAQFQQQIQMQLATFSNSAAMAAAAAAASATVSPASASPPGSPTAGFASTPVSTTSPKLRSRASTSPGVSGSPTQQQATSVPTKKKRENKGKLKNKSSSPAVISGDEDIVGHQKG
ncbi:hypothetical protein HDU67_000172 [Dinochytrium kinnereticum]|nr:hypothetical protein HDU67_000172 [Dinochytrium kinnereticum]